MKTSCYRIVISLTIVVITNLSCPGLVQYSNASPLGTTYSAALDIPVLVQPGDQEQTEGHLNDEIPFDKVYQAHTHLRFSGQTFKAGFCILTDDICLQQNLAGIR